LRVVLPCTCARSYRRASSAVAAAAAVFQDRRALAALTQRSMRSQATSQTPSWVSVSSRTSRPRSSSCSRVRGCPSRLTRLRLLRTRASRTTAVPGE
jgi:hypothetical protein